MLEGRQIEQRQIARGDRRLGIGGAAEKKLKVIVPAQVELDFLQRPFDRAGFALETELAAADRDVTGFETAAQFWQGGQSLEGLTGGSWC